MKPRSEKEILEAAIRVFAKTGYHGSSIQDITKEAGVSKALFYHYLRVKETCLSFESIGSLRREGYR